MSLAIRRVVSPQSSPALSTAPPGPGHPGMEQPPPSLHARGGPCQGPSRGGSPVQPIGLMQTSIESLPRTEAVDLEFLSLDRIVHPDPAVRSQSKPPETRVPRQFLHPIAWPWPKRLIQETPDCVEELLLCFRVWNVLKGHGSLPLSKKLLVYPFEFAGPKPATPLPAFFELGQPLRRIILIQQLEEELIPRLRPRLLGL